MQKTTKPRGIPFFKKLFFFIIILVIFGGIGLWYVNEYILPEKGRVLVINYLTKATGRKVTLGSIYYNPFRGIALKNLTISDDPKYQRTFLKIERLYFNVLYLPIFQEKKIIVPLVKVERPKFILTVDDKNRWNFESLEFLKPKKTTPPQTTPIQATPTETPTSESPTSESPTEVAPRETDPFKVYIYKVTLSNATCTFEDRALEPIFSKEIKNLDLQASISYPLKIRYKLNSQLTVKQKNSIAARGEFDPAKKQLSLDLELKDIPLAEFQPYYADLPFKSLSGNLSGETDLLYSTTDAYKISTTSTITKLNVVGNDFVAKGDADIKGKVDFNPKDKATLKYSGDAILKNAVIKGVPTFDVVEKINGKVLFDETKLWVDSIKGTSRGLDFVLAGSLKDYANPYLALTAKTTVNLSKLNEFLTAEMKEKLKDYEIAGVSQTTLNVAGLLKGKTPLDYTLTSSLSDCNVKAKFLPKPITSINGTLITKANSANLKDFSAIYNDKSYSLSGDVTNFKTPKFNLALASDDLKLKTDFVWQDNLATFNKFEGKYKNTKFNLFGAASDFKDPLLNVYGSVALDVDELKLYLPKEDVEFLTKNEVNGALLVKLYFNGRPKDKKTWAMELKAQSPQLQIQKIKFDELSVDYKFKDNFVSMQTITAKPYGGSLVGNVAIDFTQENPQYAIEVDIKDVDISKWKNDTELKKYDLRGLFYAKAEFGGFGEKIETLRGKGQFAIVNGKLWELPVFAGLANILFIPGVDRIVFREAHGSFTVGNKVIYTSNTEIHATEMNLIYDGTVDFDGNLDFSITATFAKNLLSIPSGLGPLRDLLVDQAGNYIGDIKLKGTLKEPRHTIKPFPIDKILQKKLLDKFRGLFEGRSE